jgi:hypothetical protein
MVAKVTVATEAARAEVKYFFMGDPSKDGQTRAQQ